MSPILLRPVREQLEHDRVIRLLQARLKRRYQVGINPGSETNVAVGTGDASIYPDVVLTPPGSRKPEVVIEVETGESVNRMEALFEWARLAQERAAFHLYVPLGSIEVARRLCEENGIRVSEIWTFHHIGDQIRFTQVFRAPAGPPQKPAAASKAPKSTTTKPAVTKKAAVSTAGRGQSPKRSATPAAPARSRAAKTASARPAAARRSGGSARPKRRS